MSTQQDIYGAGSENRPPMLNKENYVSWSSRLLWYSKSRSNGKLIHKSIINGPYFRRMIPEPANDQAIQTILLGLPEDIYAAVDSYETTQEIWFTSNDGESIESYYHRFLKLMNDLKRNKHFPEKIADITDPTTVMNMALPLMAKAFKLNYSTPTNNNQRISSNPRNRQIAQPVTYTFVHSEARSWSIPSEDPYEEAAQQLLEQAPCSPEYVPDPIELEDHVPLYIPEHPEDLLPAKDEAHIEACILEVDSAATPLLPPSFLSPWTPPLLPIPLPVPSTSHRAEILEADTPLWKRLLLTALRPGCEVGESSAAAAARQPGPTMARSVNCSFVDTIETSRECSEFYSRHHDAQKDRATVRAEIEVLRRERLAYEQEMLETQVRRHEWQRQTADDFALQHIMCTQALEAGARIDTLEDTGSSS
nr:hypothetical protein [Tanacetum cinerariifolium]